MTEPRIIVAVRATLPPDAERGARARMYRPGDESRLAVDLSPDELLRLERRGFISGFISGDGER
jgi:hypothetical protein